MRELVLERDEKKCVNCDSKEKLEVHHTTYKHHGDELNHLEDLETLCHDCHEGWHISQEHVKIFQGFALTASETLDGISIKMLIYFTFVMDVTNRVVSNTKTIAGKLDLNERTVIKGMKNLIRHNIIIKKTSPFDERQYEYYLNPLAAYRVHSNEYEKLIAKIEAGGISLKLFPHEKM